MSTLDSLFRRSWFLRFEFDVIPAEAGIQSQRSKLLWIPAFAGMTANVGSSVFNYTQKCFMNVMTAREKPLVVADF